MQLDYRATVNLIPDIDSMYRAAIGDYAAIKNQTVAYSTHDALSLASNAKPESVINFWNANLKAKVNREFVEENWKNIAYYNLPGWLPYTQNVISELTRKSSSYYPARAATDIYYVTIHHSVSWFDNASNFANVERMASYHVNTRGWPAIGYHYVVAPDGQIYQGNGILQSSYHAGSFDAPGDENKTAVGICLGGDFRTHPPSEPQIFAAASLTQYMRDTLPNHISVQPHKRMPGAATVCPGYNIEKWLKNIDGLEPLF